MSCIPTCGLLLATPEQQHVLLLSHTAVPRPSCGPSALLLLLFDLLRRLCTSAEIAIEPTWLNGGLLLLTTTRAETQTQMRHLSSRQKFKPCWSAELVSLYPFSPEHWTEDRGMTGVEEENHGLLLSVLL